MQVKIINAHDPKGRQGGNLEFRDKEGNIVSPMSFPTGTYKMVPVEEGHILSIVCNKGVHAIDEGQLPGEVYYASEGNLGGTPMNSDDLKVDFEQAIKRTASKLKSQHWSRVYLVPSGLPSLAIHLSALVHQVTAHPAIPLQFDRNSGEYWSMDLEIRRLVTES